jgi:hypothetical protein
MQGAVRHGIMQQLLTLLAWYDRSLIGLNRAARASTVGRCTSGPEIQLGIKVYIKFYFRVPFLFLRGGLVGRSSEKVNTFWEISAPTYWPGMSFFCRVQTAKCLISDLKSIKSLLEN